MSKKVSLSLKDVLLISKELLSTVGITLTEAGWFMGREKILLEPKELIPISQLAEISGDSRLYHEATLEYKGRKIETFVRFYVDKNMKIRIEDSGIKTIELLNAEEIKNKDILSKIKNYVGMYGPLIVLIISKLLERFL